MKSLNDIFQKCAKESNLHTSMYARIKEANYLMDQITEFPVLLRLFNESISETTNDTERRRTTTLHFCDVLGKAEPNTETEVRPIVEKMEQRAFDFINRLRSEGVQVAIVSNMTPFYAKFDALVAGVSVGITITYNVC